VVFATGTENAGMSVFVQNDRLVVDYNAFDDHTLVESTFAIPTGDSTLAVRFRRDGRSGSVALEIDGRPAGSAELPLYMRMMSSVGPSIGYDHGSAVSNRYQAPFKFTGTLHQVVIQLLSPQDLAAIEAHATAEMSRQ
jgi:arylsulfatase